MKEFLSLIALAITIGLTSCSDDDCTHNGPTPPEQHSIYGSWYEEAMNEEFDVNENGTFYDKYCNVERGGETEGKCMYDSKNKKLTETYSFMGQTHFIDWKVTNLTDLGLTIYSEDHGQHIYEKIVETYQMKVGETAKIKFAEVYTDYSVLDYSSSNERLASVTSDGIIKAEGEKGTQYIKVTTNKCNVWVKVIVGDNCADLWYDYVSLIGQDYTGMRKFLNTLGEPYSGDDGYSFGFLNATHDYIDITKVYLCPVEGIVTEIQLLAKEAVPESEILAYMNSHYYKFQESGDYVFYSNIEDYVNSKAIIAYSKSTKTIFLNETEHFFNEPMHGKDFWPDFAPMFGKNSSQVKTAMKDYGCSYLMTDKSYSMNGSDYYSVSGNPYVQMYAFVFNPDNQMSEYWVYVDYSTDPNEIYRDYLLKRFKEDKSEASSTKVVFYNEDKTLRVVFDLTYPALIYTDLTKKPIEKDTRIWPDYNDYFGFTKDKIKAEFGNPILEYDDYYAYVVGSENVKFLYFYFRDGSTTCNAVTLYLNDGISNKTVVDYFNGRYNIYEKGTDSSQYAWIDGTTTANSSVGILYIPASNVVSYTSLNSSNSAKSAFLPSTVDTTVSRSKSMLSKAQRAKRGFETIRKQLFEERIKEFK